MERLKQKYALDIQWHAFELRPPGSPPMTSEFKAYIEKARPHLIDRARREYGLNLNIGPFDIDTRPALIGEQVAQRQGLGNAYHDAVAQAYWAKGCNISDRDLLADLAASVGLDRAAFLVALDDPAYQQAMLNDVRTAHTYGLTGVPALVFDDKYLVVGAQPISILEQVVRRCQEERELA